MAIRKFGTEPAKTEVRAEDNDRETLEQVKKAAASEVEVTTDEDRRPRR